jgi:NAD+ kinase
VHTLLEKQDRIPTQAFNASSEGLAGERRMDKGPDDNTETSEPHHSRLLTKQQISDMAFGIRELSKKLAQIRLKLHVKNIFILGKAHDETLIGHSREITDWLLKVDPAKAGQQGENGTSSGGREGGYRVYVEETLEHNKIFDAAGLLEDNPGYKGRLRFWNKKLCTERPQTFDIVLAVSL